MALSTEVAGNILGTAGTSLLLLAFALNVSGRLQVSFAYTYMNLIGSGLAAMASLAIGFLPFVVLEGAWFAAAAAKLVSLHGPAE